MTAKQITPALPPELNGWRWHTYRTRDTTTGPLTEKYHLEGPDGWNTKTYQKPERAIAEAKRRVLSTPRPKPVEQQPTVQAVAVAAESGALLGTAEQADLARCEAAIARGLQTFIEVGEALAEIREKRLYRAAFGTFEDYCREKWGIGASRARQIIGAAAVAGTIESVTAVTPANEAQMRPLAGLPAEQQRAAWSQAVETAGGQPTAKQVEQAVQTVTPPPAVSTLRCTRCGAEGTPTRALTVYGKGLVPEYPDRAVTLCSVCIPELLAARKAAATPSRLPLDLQQRLVAAGAALLPDGTVLPPRNAGEAAQRLTEAEAEAALARWQAIPHLPPDFAAAQKRATAIGLHLEMNAHGEFSLKNAGGSGVSGYRDWSQMLAHLANQERAHAENEAERAQRQQLAGDLITARRARDWWNVGTYFRALDVALNGHDRAGAVQTALQLAAALAGDRLDDYAERLTDAEYEALARLTRHEESEVTI